jgi:hypothetical protein
MSAKHTAVPIRLASQGARVVLLHQQSLVGTVREVRLEPYLRTYVVACDDGQVKYASGHDLALASDPTHTPLAPTPEY